MAVRITKGDITIEIDFDDHFPAVIEHLGRVLGIGVLNGASPQNGTPTTVQEVPRHGSDMPGSFSRATVISADKTTRMPARECIKLAFEQTNRAMTADELHDYMKATNRRYGPKANDPIHNIKQTLRNNPQDFKEYESGKWQGVFWDALAGLSSEETRELWRTADNDKSWFGLEDQPEPAATPAKDQSGVGVIQRNISPHVPNAMRSSAFRPAQRPSTHQIRPARQQPAPSPNTDFDDDYGDLTDPFAE